MSLINSVEDFSLEKTECIAININQMLIFFKHHLVILTR